MNAPLKKSALRILGQKRRSTRWEGYKSIGDYHNGLYECEFVSPYSKTAGNVDSDIMIVLQDWSSDEHLSKPVNLNVAREGREASLPTNRNLDALLNQHFGAGISEMYATNLFPFVKSGGMSARIPSKDFVRAAKEFALPEIQIIRPKLVIALGVPAFNALRRAVSQPPVENLDAGQETEFEIRGTRVWCQAHTGNLGRNNRNRGGVDRVAEDWETMAEWYEQADESVFADSELMPV